MTDLIHGKVTEIIDGDTFWVKVTWESQNNQYEYNDVEKIRIADFDAPELPTSRGKRAKKYLEKHLLGCTVSLTVHARDKYGRLVCDVRIIS